MQASIPRLTDLVDDQGTNIVEIFCCPSYFKDISNNGNIINIKWTKPAEFFSLENPQTEIQYYHRDMCYVFDVSNDAQKGYRRILKKDLFYRNIYITAIQEEIIPSHYFPSTKDITEIVKITRHTQKINNRMHWINETDDNGGWVSYIRYQHAPNVEMTKMQQDLEKTIDRMSKPN